MEVKSFTDALDERKSAAERPKCRVMHRHIIVIRLNLKHSTRAHARFQEVSAAGASLPKLCLSFVPVNPMRSTVSVCRHA